MNASQPDPHPLTASSKPFVQYVDGFPLPGLLPVDSYRSALKYKPRPDDVFIATYPKCGTTWTQHMLVLTFRQGEPITNQLHFFTASPFLEMAGAEAVETIPRPIALKTHLPYHLTPRSDQAKYIYITRNPKDCCVSYFHHMRSYPIHGFNGTFDEFFEVFMSGKIDFGDYFDHLLGWYAHRNDPNVLFLTYEQMKENPEDAILKIASFVDDKLYAEPLRNDPEKLKNVVLYSSFQYMKEAVNKGIETMFKMSQEEVLNSELPTQMKEMFANFARIQIESGAEPPNMCDFIRKGIIGDWKNYFTEEQCKRLDEKFAERTKDTDLPDLLRKYM